MKDQEEKRKKRQEELEKEIYGNIGKMTINSTAAGKLKIHSNNLHNAEELAHIKNQLS